VSASTDRAGKEAPPDPRFYTRAEPVRLAALADTLGWPGVEGDETVIAGTAPVEAAGPEHLTFAVDERAQRSLSDRDVGAVLLPELAKPTGAHGVEIRVSDPKHAFALAARHFFREDSAHWPSGPALSDRADIPSSVRLSHGVVIAEGVSLGERVCVGPGVVLLPGVVIGDDCEIGPGCVISHSIIGDRVRFQPGAKIGQAGFGYAGSVKGHERMPHLGRVIIEDDVDIGANVTIDRGSWGDTLIARGVKIDNLVHVAHSCHIGQGAILAGQVGIAGSSSVGPFAVLGGQVGVADHVHIGDGAQIGACAGVMRDLAAGGRYLGVPAKPAKGFFREVIALERLAKERQHRHKADSGDDDNGGHTS
jgi:UDP-3-O-[3-hydroxymyristoyl] glucosamine N-acyltransferase